MTVKDVVADRERLARFSHYIDGNLYYIVEVEGKTYQFPIRVSSSDPEEDKKAKADVGTTTFVDQYRAITLMRYIRKAIDSENFIRVK